MIVNTTADNVAAEVEKYRDQRKYQQNQLSLQYLQKFKPMMGEEEVTTYQKQFDSFQETSFEPHFDRFYVWVVNAHQTNVEQHNMQMTLRIIILVFLVIFLLVLIIMAYKRCKKKKKKHQEKDIRQRK